MDMSGMGGMDMSSSGLFTGVNKAIAHGFWYAIAGYVGLLTIARAIAWNQSRQRQASHKTGGRLVPSRPQGTLGEMYATITAALREMSYPQPLWFSGAFSKYFSPPPLGRCILLAVYWIMILTMLWSNVILSPGSSMYAYKWEKVGFRAAWVSVTQIPFIYLLSAKFNPISILTGISYERFNWLHRWAARTVFLTIIVHWSFFFREWYLGNFVNLEIELMPMVKYGFGAWGVIGWMILSGFGYFRAKCYELFVAQHIVAAAVLLWLIHKHVPAYAQYNMWLSVGFVVFDWGARVLWGIARNTHLLSRFAIKTPGYSATIETLPGDMVRVTLEDVDFKWKAGQHAYVNFPSTRPFELHPFTIANASQSEVGRHMTFLIKARSGFSRSLQKLAQKDALTGNKRRVFISGPWGSPPDLLHYDTVVLIACSSGASFIIPLLTDLVTKRGCVDRIHLHWIIRSHEHFTWFQQDLTRAVEAARTAGLNLHITIHVTQTNHSEIGTDYDTQPSLTSEEKASMDKVLVSVDSASTSRSSASSASFSSTEKPSATQTTILLQQPSRPSVESLIRPPVEAALGETAVVVCGGLGITAQTRNLVASLSDERAVHKGSGAQGIKLFTETYGW